jgi:hypothetical protein
MSVKFIELDVINYNGNKDFQVLTEYISNRSYNLIVRRLDSFSKGWDENLDVLVSYLIYDNYTKIINIGSSDINEKIILVETNFDIDYSNKKIEKLKNYEMIPFPEYHPTINNFTEWHYHPIHIDYKDFNILFDTNIPVLPYTLHAIGFKNKLVYMYNQKYDNYYEIIPIMHHIISTVISKKIFKEFYILVDAGDGYMDYHYPSKRNIPKFISEFHFNDINYMKIEHPNEYAVFHKYKYTIAMNNKIDIDYTLDITHRFYFEHDYILYNKFRSIHKGIKFNNKINLIVYAGQDQNGSKYNYLYRRDIEINQRKYFKNFAKDKKYIYYPNKIKIDDMVTFKYILDIDGWANTWDGTAWKLNSGSVIFKSATTWRNWFSDEYLPWVHYIPINDDFSDIEEKYKWCENNQNSCLEIIENAKKLFQKTYRFENIVNNTINILYKSNLLIPTINNNKRLFFITDNDNIDIKNIIINKQVSTGNDMFKEVSKKLFDEDIIIYIKDNNTIFNDIILEEFINKYDCLNKKIINIDNTINYFQND